MAVRIDGLIASHKEMSNAVSHEIKTPLARMQFEIELAQQSTDMAEIRRGFSNIKSDVGAINDLITATMDYAILERADVSLNFGEHNFAALIPAIVDTVGRERPDIRVQSDVQRRRRECYLRYLSSRNGASKSALQRDPLCKERGSRHVRRAR